MPETIETVDMITEDIPTIEEMEIIDDDYLLGILGEEFSPDEIKQKPGSGNMTFDYVETHNVIKRLNKAFGLQWSWEVTDKIILEKEVVVEGKLTIFRDDKFFVKCDYGNKELYSNTKIGDGLKAANSDALKRAARQMEVALHLYEKPVNNTIGNITPRRRRGF